METLYRILMHPLLLLLIAAVAFYYCIEDQPILSTETPFKVGSISALDRATELGFNCQRQASEYVCY